MAKNISNKTKPADKPTVSQVSGLNSKSASTGLYVQYGCGLIAPEEWVNFDISPTLRIQRIPVIGKRLKTRMSTVFPSNVRYGDIVKGLPVNDGECDGVYCAHTLEHLSLEDCRIAIKNTYSLLKMDGIFRCIVPDLEYAAKRYISSLDRGDSHASHRFMGGISGVKSRPKGLKGLISSYWGNSRHLWMWDRKSLAEELKNAGFIQIRSCQFNDCEDPMFNYVEDAGRFINAVAIECRK